MATGSGVGSVFGASKETVYGTRVAPARFWRAKSHLASYAPTRPQGEGIQGGALGPLGAHLVETVQAATGSVALDVTQKDMGILLEQIMGGVSASLVNVSSSYTQTHTLGDKTGKSMSVQSQVPYRGGAQAPQDLTGAVVTSAAFSCAVNGILGLDLTLDAQKFDDSQSAATASYTTASAPFHGGQMALKLGTFGAEAAVLGVREVSATIAHPMDTEDYTAGASGLKSAPVLNDVVAISGSITSDWLAKADFATRLKALTLPSLVWEFKGAVALETTYFPTFRLTVPGVAFSGDMQGVDGRGELTNQWAWSWVFDGTNAPKIEYITSDVAL